MCRLPLISLVLLIAAHAAFAHEQDFAGEGDGDGQPQLLAPCADGGAFFFPCSNVDLVAWLPPQALGDIAANDVWGWTDPESGREYALIGLIGGTAFIEVSDPANPVYLGTLPTQTFNSTWRDIKTYGHYAFIVSEAANHGLQIFDLHALFAVANPPAVFEASAHYAGFGNSHNIAINEDTGIAFALGTQTCSGGLHMIDIRDPLAPLFLGCFSEAGYSHDAQCVTYRGPDLEHLGSEICFNSNEDSLIIADVSHKDAPRLLSRSEYATSGYTHQGWLTEDHRFFLLGDEFDELAGGVFARTYIWDVSDLDAPSLAGSYIADTRSIDHNVLVSGNHAFEANYLSGLRVLRLGDLARAEMTEVAFFDTSPGRDGLRFEGAWGVYPFFESGLVLVSDIYNGLFVLAPDLDAVPECSDGIDNDADGLRDFPDDPSCASADSAAEFPRSDIAIDILPGNARNPIRPHAFGVIAVAVLGSENFEVTTVDSASLHFGPGQAAARLDGFRSRKFYRDVNRDGEIDLVAHYSVRDAGLHHADKQACLDGSTVDGTPFRACDSIRSVGLSHRP